MTDSPIHEFPDEFIEDVKTALENLYDFPTLQRHALIRRLPSSTTMGTQNPNALMLDAICLTCFLGWTRVARVHV